MKIEKQIMAQKPIFAKSKLMLSSDIDNEWNDFLMIRGCNWEPSTDTADDNGNKSINNGKNSNNNNNYKKNIDGKKYKKCDEDDEQ